MHYETIYLHDIETPSFFSFFLFKKKSDQHFTYYPVMMPILVQKRGKKFHILDGFKRFQFSINQGLEKIPALIIPENTPFIRCLFYFLSQKPSLSFIEKSHFINVLQKTGVSSEELNRIFPMVLNHNVSTVVLKQVLEIGSFPEEIKEFAEEKQLSFKQCKKLTFLNKEQLKEVASLIKDYPLTASLFLELLDLFTMAIKKYQHPSIASVIAKLHDLSENSPVKRVEKLKKALTAYVKPLNLKIENRLREKKKKMPKGIELFWDPSFEIKNVQISFQIKKENEFDHYLKELKASKSTLMDILNDL